MNSDIHIASNEFKECARIGCEKIANTVLEVKYIQKVGHFCGPCAKELLQSELVQNIKKRDDGI